MSRASWISPKLDVRPSPISARGLFARRRVETGEVLARLSDTFVIMSDEEFREYTSTIDTFDAVALGGGRHKVWLEGREANPASFGNHSCEPNAELGPEGLIATCAIEAGEEVTVDYALLSATSWSMDCHCGSVNCRGVVRGVR